MRLRATFLLPAVLVAAALLAGCASPEESAGGGATDSTGAPCPVAGETGGESGHPEGSTGSGTGDITTMDGGDPSRDANEPGALRDCAAGGTTANGDGASTGLGEPGGGFSTAEE